MNITELITNLEVERDQHKADADRSRAEIKYILEQGSKEGRTNLSPEESERMTQLFQKVERKKTDLEGVEVRLESARRARVLEMEAIEASNERSSADSATRPAYDGVARVGREERTYRQDSDPKGKVFLRDVARQFLYNDLHASQRLSDHMREERVERGEYLQRAAGDTTTTNWSGLVVPQYLTDMYAPATAAMRPFANACASHDLPADGLTVNISRVTTPSTVALQTSELAAMTPTSLDDTLLTESIQTALGEQTMSRQAIDRGTGIEEVVMNDLFRRYATMLDSTLINQATTGLSAVAQNNDTTNVDPTAAAGFYTKLHAALAGLEAGFLGFAAPTHVIMHSRRWYSLSAKLTTSWPLVQQPGVQPQTIGINYGVDYDKGIRGILPNGLRVIVDNNITTTGGGTAGTQDEAYVIAAEECHLWEDAAAPYFIRAEQPKANVLGVLLVLYGYFAYSFRRYANGQQKLTGAGMIAPTF